MVRGVNGGCFVVENQKWVSEWSPPQSPAPRAGTGADWEGGGGGGEEEEEVEEGGANGGGGDCAGHNRGKLGDPQDLEMQ